MHLLLVFDIDYGRLVKTVPVPLIKNPLHAAFLLGLTFGLIILPCNAAAIAVLLALASSAPGFVDGLGSFLCFGFGITVPLLLAATLSRVRSRQVMGFLNAHRRPIRVTSGILMMAISLWYLILLFFSRNRLVKTPENHPAPLVTIPEPPEINR